MQGRAPAKISPRANTATTAKGITEARILKRNMKHHPPARPCRAGAYGCRSVNKSSYRRVDVGVATMFRLILERPQPQHGAFIRAHGRAGWLCYDAAYWPWARLPRPRATPATRYARFRAQAHLACCGARSGRACA